MAEDSPELDDEFDKFLAEMKPYVLKLPHASERQRCALWIKKLCEAPGHGTVGRKNRNMYTKLLVHMLKKGMLEGPFSSRPDPGPLPTLPAYTSIYFDEPTQTRALRRGEQGHILPDWVSGELWSGQESAELRSSVRSKVKATSILQERQMNVETRPKGMRDGGEGDIRSNGQPDSYQTHLDVARAEIRNRHKVSFSYSSDEDEDPNPRKKGAKSSATKIPSDRGVLTGLDWATFEPSSASTRRAGAAPSLPLGLRGGEGRLASSLAMDDVAMETRRQEEQHLEMRTKLLEAKFHEEKLSIQQRHDEAIQKILDRKNAEMDEIKTHYRNKVTDLEETNRKLDRKLQTLTKEYGVAKESRDKQIAELRKMVERTSQTTLNDYEKRLHEAVADLEQEKFEMQKKQTSAIQDILEDTNTKLAKMEAEYNAQVDSHAKVIHDLEAKVHQLTKESADQNAAQTRLSEDKAEMERRAKMLNVELENITKRYVELEKQYETRRDDHEREVMHLRGKAEARVEFLKEEHSSAFTKLTESNKDLEDRVHELRQALQDSELSRQRQIRELESEHKQECLHQEQLSERRLQGLRSQLELEKEDLERQLRQAQNTNQDKEEQLKRLKEVQRLQAQQAERALEEFKTQVEHNSGRMFDEMKTQMAKVEADLATSKELRERQLEEFTKQREEERRAHQRQISELELSHQRERASLLEQCQEEKERVGEEQEALLASTREGLEQRLQLVEGRAQEQQKRDAGTISELERQLREVKEEILQGDSLRKQQLVELGLLREEERQKVQREHETEVRQLRSEMDQYRISLQKEHSTQMDQALKQTNDRLKDIERDYSNRLDQASETIKEHQLTIERLREESQVAKSNMELQLSETVSKLEDEKELLRRQHEAYNKAVQRELDDQRQRIKQLERRLQQQELDHQEKILQVQHEYEAKSRGLLPASIQQELEATITSLKSQVTTLQQRVLVLQEEIDMRNKHISRFSPSRN
ncbi:centrosomal protein of 112 kDa-like [Diadema setosum]|uniref:centrosomal protein of 112 kDa-like n=1 Tax=Diadema setosum TaxID=31175 RepID=UPI003B3BE94F